MATCASPEKMHRAQRDIVLPFLFVRLSGCLYVRPMPLLCLNECICDIKNSSKHIHCWRFGLYNQRPSSDSEDEAGSSSSSFWHSWRAKKAVISLTELIAAFIAIHDLWTCLADVYVLLDQPSKTVWLSLSITVALDQLVMRFSWFAWRGQQICFNRPTERAKERTHPHAVHFCRSSSVILDDIIVFARTPRSFQGGKNCDFRLKSLFMSIENGTRL